MAVRAALSARHVGCCSSTSLLLWSSFFVAFEPVAGSMYWRLLCNSTTTEEWHLCDVGFYTDTACKRPPPASFAGLLHSETRTGSVGVTPDHFLYDWASNCSTCEAGEAYVGVIFDRAAVVQCARYSECVTTSTATSSTATTSTRTFTGSTAAPSPSPSPTPLPSGPTTTTNPFLGLGGSRRLGARSCHTVLLQRSDTSVGWSNVGEWQAPELDTDLSLTNSVSRPLYSPPSLTAWSPSSQSCGFCGVHGLQVREQVQAKFSAPIFPGSGSITFEKGGLGSQAVPITDTSWFFFDGSKMTITPQSDLGASGGCTKVTFVSCPIVTADGYCYNNPVGYTFCIADLRAPVLQTTDPSDGGVAASLRMQMRLAFDEEVSIAPSASKGKLTLLQSSQAWPEFTNIDMNGGQVAVYTWNAVTGAQEVEITVDAALPSESVFRLEVPGGVVVDRAGNAWGGNSLVFTTPCGPAGCVTKTRTTTADPTVAAAQEESQPVALYLGITVAVLCCGGCALYAWRLYVKSLFGTGDGEDGPGRSYASTKVAPAPSVEGVSYAARTQQYSGGQQGGGWGGAAGAARADSEANQQRGAYGTSAATPPVAGGGLRHAAWGDAEDIAPPASAGASPGFRHQRSKEAEDIPSHSQRFAGAEPAPSGRGRGHFTEESFSAGGWVKQVDPATGRPFWMHYKTRETRWDPPPKSTGATVGAPPRGKQQKAPAAELPRAAQEQPRQEARQEPPPKKKAQTSQPLVIDTSSLEEAEEAARVKAEISDQLQKTMHEDIASRKKTFKFLCLKWHPDKHKDGNVELATSVFQFVQTQKDWYLKETN